MTTVSKAVLHSSVREGNRISIPAIILESVGIKVGDPIKIILEGDTLTVTKM